MKSAHRSRKGIGTRLRACLQAGFLSLVAPSQFILAQPAVTSSEADLLLLEVRLGRDVINSGLGAYQAGKHVLLPIGELSRLLTIAIDADPGQGQATGFVLSEQRAFHLDAVQSAVTLEGKQRWFASDLIQIRSDDIYVASELLARWLPVDLEVDFPALRLNVRAREPLPLQRRLERELRAGHAGPGVPGQDPGYPRMEVPYRVWDVPALDLTLGAEVNHANGSVRDAENFAAFATGDLLGLQATAYLSGTTEKQSGRHRRIDSRLTLGRDDPDAGLLGPLRARSFAIGSVTVPAQANVARTSPIGEGFTLTNAPLVQSSAFGQHSLRGDLPPGWDVELYVNEALLGYQQSRSDGRYAFDDVPLIYGDNEFRLVFHGPQGQTRVERQMVSLDQSLIRPGEFHYRLAAHEDARDEPRAIAQFDWGLTRQLSGTMGFASLPLAGGAQHYANAGLRALWESVLMTGDVVRSESGSLAEVSMQARFGGMRIGLGRTALTNGFASEEFLPATDGIRIRDRARLDWAVPVRGAMSLPVTFEAKRDLLRSGSSNLETGLRVTGGWRGIFLTQQVRWQLQGADESASGMTQVSSRFGALGVRGGASYELGSGKRINEGSVSVDRRLGEGLLLTATVARTLVPSETNYGIAFTKGVGRYGVRVGANRSSHGETRVGVQLLVALAREPRAGTWRFDALPMADSGGVSARVFLDRNVNGTEDEGDEPLPGVAFKIDGGRHPVRTNEQGTAFLHRLPTRRHVNVEIDGSTLEDPQWAARLEGVRLVPRPGKNLPVDFPVILTGEIDGTVRIVDEGNARGIGGVELELLDRDRRVVRRATTASDGFYIVEAVPPGTYELRIPSEHLRARGLVETGRPTVTMSPEGDFVNGVDFDLLVDKERVPSRPTGRP